MQQNFGDTILCALIPCIDVHLFFVFFLIKLLTEIFDFYMPVLDGMYYGIQLSIRPSTRRTKTQFALSNPHEILTQHKD